METLRCISLCTGIPFKWEDFAYDNDVKENTLKLLDTMKSYLISTKRDHDRINVIHSLLASFSRDCIAGRELIKEWEKTHPRACARDPWCGK